jgi:prephenate dehydrogenase
VETVLARLAPLEAQLGELQAALADRDPKAVLDGLSLRLDALQSRLGILETPGENPFAEISEQLTRLYAQKDAAVETVLARLAPLEAQLGELQAALADRDPKAVLDGFAARLDALQARLDAPGENPFAGVSEQLTRLYAQKDAAVETVLTRLAPLEAQLVELQAALDARDPKTMLDGFAARLDALQSRLGALETPGENPFAEISAQLTRLYAQKDAAVETVITRLAPLEAQLVELQAALDARDPKTMLDGFAARLDALQSRLGALETPGENPFAEISEQLTRLYAQKDAAVETVFARLAPLEARLTELQALAPQVAALASSGAVADPRAALDDFAVRIETLHRTQGEVAAGLAALRAVIGDGSVAQPFAAIAEQLTQLHAQKDAALAAVEARLAEMDARIDARAEGEPGDAEEAARSEARAIAEELAQLRATAAQTELFADRLAVLEASLPRLNAAQSQMMRVLERQAGGSALPAALTDPLAAAPTGAETAPAPEPPDPFAAFRDLPRVVSLHHK